MALAMFVASSPLRASAQDVDEDIFLDPETDIEYIEVYNEKKTKPFKRDTELRLTGESLKKQGVINLAQALELLPDVYICLLYTSPSPRDATLSRMPSSA